MAKKTEKIGVTVDALRPYLERALKDEEFRRDLRDAMETARELYGDLAKGNGGVKSATRFATDKDVQENLRKALDWLPKGRHLLTIRTDCDLKDHIPGFPALEDIVISMPNFTFTSTPMRRCSAMRGS